MMAERLEEIRRDLDSEAYTSYLPKTVRELLDYIAQLEARESQRTAERLPKDGDELQAMLNKAYRKGNDDAHAAHTVMGIAQLEAQRGANVLATCANCAQRGHCVHAKLGEAFEDHIVQRGGAFVVPAKMDDDDWEAIGFQQSTEGQLQRVWDRAVSRIQPIPADLVLGEGMVGVDREAIKTAIGLVRCLVVGPGSGQDALSAMESALRSAKGETTP